MDDEDLVEVLGAEGLAVESIGLSGLQPSVRGTAPESGHRCYADGVTTAIRSPSTVLGPEDHGRRMSLAEFARAEGRGGYLYELAKGVVIVLDVPGVRHALVAQAIDEHIRVYEIAHPGTIHLLAPGSDCALRLPGLQSERHPDRALYLTPPPSDNPWNSWTPEIAIEVVSRGQEERDYGEKREEYLRAGVREYWIVDPHRRTALFLRRQGDEWSEEEKGPGAVYATPLLPGFALDLGAVFAVLACA